MVRRSDQRQTATAAATSVRRDADLLDDVEAHAKRAAVRKSSTHKGCVKR